MSWAIVQVGLWTTNDVVGVHIVSAEQRTFVCTEKHKQQEVHSVCPVQLEN